ncbi:MAG: hypothetical protein IPO48_19970 [Saprospiraceae bacterium]|nr:hypothetical protein [Saprospiraceae bacterium]
MNLELGQLLCPTMKWHVLYWGKVRTLAIKEDMKICKPYTEYVGKFTEEPKVGFYKQAFEVMSQNAPYLI